MAFQDKELSGSFIISFSPDKDQSQEGNDPVYDQQLKPERIIIEQPAGVMAKGQAEQRGKDGNKGHKPVPQLIFRKQAKAIQTQ